MKRTLLHSSLLVALLSVIVTAEAKPPENALVTYPNVDPPKAGWATIVLLHGYGTNKEDFSAVSKALAQHGVAVFSVDAPLSIGDGRRSWPRDNDKSYAAVRPTLDFIAEDDRFDARRVFVGGFSQGAYHSLLMGKAHVSEFAGLMIISPGGGSALPTGWQGKDFKQPLYLLSGTQEGDGIRELVDRAAKEWRQAGQRVLVESHPGGHHFPEDWETVLGHAMDWLLEDN